MEDVGVTTGEVAVTVAVAVEAVEEALRLP
jgi:hypothetical protein